MTKATCPLMDRGKTAVARTRARGSVAGASRVAAGDNARVGRGTNRIRMVKAAFVGIDCEELTLLRTMAYG